MILDLSHSVQINGEQIPSVNEVTDKTISPAHSMMELRNVLPCMIYAVTMAHKSKGPVLFSKLDIKDGYWIMVVPAEDEWNFAPAFFCSALEMARDIAAMLKSKPMGVRCQRMSWNQPFLADAIGKLLHPNSGLS